MLFDNKTKNNQKKMEKRLLKMCNATPLEAPQIQAWGLMGMNFTFCSIVSFMYAKNEMKSY
jgi:hypothetical protein